MVVVFSGYNQRAVVAFLRTLASNKVDYCIIASSIKDTILLSSYKDKVLLIRNKNELDLNDFEEIIRCIKSKSIDFNKVMIAPSTEYLNRFLLKHRSFLEKIGFIIPLVNEDIYCKISDKESFEYICRRYGIKCPEVVDEIEVHNQIVVKPKKYFASNGQVYYPMFLNGKTEYDAFCESHNVNDFSFQEYIPDIESFYLLFYFSKSGKSIIFSQQNICQQNGGK